MQLEAVHKRYRRESGRVDALQGIDLRIDPGEFVAITGRSGSGKSTLLHLLGALDRPTEGTCRVGGRDLRQLPDDAISALRGRLFGFVFQRFHLLPQLDVLENVRLPLAYGPLPAASWATRVHDALARVGLGHRGTHRPCELSGGELQRAAIARALVGSPQAILADEPTGNLDASTGRGIIELLEHLNASGVTLVLVTHDPAVAARAHRRLALHDGRLAG